MEGNANEIVLEETSIFFFESENKDVSRRWVTNLIWQFFLLKSDHPRCRKLRWKNNVQFNWNVYFKRQADTKKNQFNYNEPFKKPFWYGFQSEAKLLIENEQFHRYKTENFPTLTESFSNFCIFQLIEFQTTYPYYKLQLLHRPMPTIFFIIFIYKGAMP